MSDASILLKTLVTIYLYTQWLNISPIRW